MTLSQLVEKVEATHHAEGAVDSSDGECTLPT